LLYETKMQLRMTEEEKGSKLYPHVSFPQELHTKKRYFCICL